MICKYSVGDTVEVKILKVTSKNILTGVRLQTLGSAVGQLISQKLASVSLIFFGCSLRARFPQLFVSKWDDLSDHRQAGTNEGFPAPA